MADQDQKPGFNPLDYLKARADEIRKKREEKSSKKKKATEFTVEQPVVTIKSTDAVQVPSSKATDIRITGSRPLNPESAVVRKENKQEGG